MAAGTIISKVQNKHLDFIVCGIVDVNALELGTLFSSCSISDSFRGSFSFPERFDKKRCKVTVQITGILSDEVDTINDTIHCILDFLSLF